MRGKKRKNKKAEGGNGMKGEVVKMPFSFLQYTEFPPPTRKFSSTPRSSET